MDDNYLVAENNENESVQSVIPLALDSIYNIPILYSGLTSLDRPGALKWHDSHGGLIKQINIMANHSVIPGPGNINTSI